VLRWNGIVVVVAALAAAGIADGAEYGTREEAKAMLDKVVAEMKSDKAATLDKINKKGFNDRDLYPFCSGPDGKITAHGAIPERLGVDQATLKDSAGKPFGAEIRKVAKPGKIEEVSYMYKRPGSTAQEPKVSLVTQVGDQVCAVGYYKK
jgi:signal transduction histidine kinase